MSGSVEDFDGLCGIIYRYSSTRLQVRCKYEMNHEGPHSWEKHISGGPIRLLVHDTTIERTALPPVGCCTAENVKSKTHYDKYCDFTIGHSGKHSWEE